MVQSSMHCEDVNPPSTCMVASDLYFKLGNTPYNVEQQQYNGLSVIWGIYAVAVISRLAKYL
jgi:hypothetical protein